MLERIIMRISYKRLLNYLTDNLGYSEIRAKRTISALRRSDSCILEAFLRWFYTSKFPKETLYGVNVKALCDRRSLDPVTAFLTVDWVAREPQAAKKALSTGHDSLILKDEDARYIEKIMECNGWEFSKDKMVQDEDESDLAVVGKNENIEE